MNARDQIVSTKPIVAIDIDGTIGDWHAHFLKFAADYSGKPMPAAEDINPGLPLHKHMRVSRATYRQMKLAFRQGGLKRSMPVFPFAGEMCRGLRRQGAEVWICTTRPYLRLDQIDPDTRHWLRRNKIQYDAVLFGERKYIDLVRHVGKDRVAAVLDDLPEMCDQAIGQGLNTIMRAQPYNKHRSDLSRINNLHLAYGVIWTDINEWKRRYARGELQLCNPR